MEQLHSNVNGNSSGESHQTAAGSVPGHGRSEKARRLLALSPQRRQEEVQMREDEARRLRAELSAATASDQQPHSLETSDLSGRDSLVGELRRRIAELMEENTILSDQPPPMYDSDEYTETNSRQDEHHTR